VCHILMGAHANHDQLHILIGVASLDTWTCSRSPRSTVANGYDMTSGGNIAVSSAQPASNVHFIASNGVSPVTAWGWSDSVWRRKACAVAIESHAEHFCSQITTPYPTPDGTAHHPDPGRRRNAGNSQVSDLLTFSDWFPRINCELILLIIFVQRNLL
jgi:hypothetical protein